MNTKKIRLRAYNHLKNEMYYPGHDNLSLNFEVAHGVVLVSAYFAQQSGHEHCRLTLMESIGAEAKNGVDIFENDIVIVDGKYQQVFWDNKSHRFIVESWKYKTGCGWIDEVDAIYGNTHQNNELLGQETPSAKSEREMAERIAVIKKRMAESLPAILEEFNKKSDEAGAEKERKEESARFGQR